MTYSSRGLQSGQGKLPCHKLPSFVHPDRRHLGSLDGQPVTTGQQELIKPVPAQNIRRRSPRRRIPHERNESLPRTHTHAHSQALGIVYRGIKNLSFILTRSPSLRYIVCIISFCAIITLQIKERHSHIYIYRYITMKIKSVMHYIRT